LLTFSSTLPAVIADGVHETMNFTSYTMAALSHTEGSYRLTSSGSNIGNAGGGFVFPTTASSIFTFDRTDGLPFTLDSMDIGELNGGVGQQNPEFICNKSGGGTVSQIHSTAGVAPTTFGFTGFFNCTSVQWDGPVPSPNTFATYDNIVAAIGLHLTNPSFEDCTGLGSACPIPNVTTPAAVTVRVLSSGGAS